jgi:hypothetical protein
LARKWDVLALAGVLYAIGCPIIQAVALSSPAAARRWGAWRWLVVVFSAKQKQQLHHQQLTNGSTILKTFTTFPEFFDLF